MPDLYILVKMNSRQINLLKQLTNEMQYNDGFKPHQVFCPENVEY